MPVSNAWPERGCSALKRVKTRLRSRLSVEMLQTLLAISINGPNVGTPECESLVTSAVDLWESQKKRRKLPRDQARNTTAPSSEGVSHPPPAVTSTAAEVAFQTEGQLEAEYTSDTTNLPPVHKFEPPAQKTTENPACTPNILQYGSEQVRLLHEHQLVYCI